MDGQEKLRARFADRLLLLDHLISSDPEFATICEDYCLAVEAERRWRAQGYTGQTRATEYAGIIEELEAEISAILDERQSERPAVGRTP